ncbi:hypothetical protein [Enterococcus canintestini]|uniref:hypothetical protein n=1 Tax=Enterococcus canintestini TaxID=317010 RepID=UPI002891182B|nr:hypothetical protein [Enterococcus canintestini]MDT2738742.1 hypothetical protein [Enterococcus canintestini]
MVMDVYSRVIDEDRSLNAKKLDEEFYGSLTESSKESNEKESPDNSSFFKNLMEFMSDETNRQQLQAMLSLANN